MLLGFGLLKIIELVVLVIFIIFIVSLRIVVFFFCCDVENFFVSFFVFGYQKVSFNYVFDVDEVFCLFFVVEDNEGFIFQCVVDEDVYYFCVLVGVLFWFKDVEVVERNNWQVVKFVEDVEVFFGGCFGYFVGGEWFRFFSFFQWEVRVVFINSCGRGKD